MATELTALWTRPSTDIKWPFEADVSWQTPEQAEARIAYFETTYLDTGLCLSMSDTVSEDGLSCESVHVFKDDEALQAFFVDTEFWVVHLAGREEYIHNNGITRTVSFGPV